MPRRALTVCLTLTFVCVAAPPALAFWSFGSPGAGYGKAGAMPGGNTPSASVAGRNVTVSWSKTSLFEGLDVDDYRVRRYDAASGTLQTIASGCASFIAMLSCTENDVPAGTWRYSVTPRLGNWIGPESALSTTVSVAAPNMTFSSSTNIASLPATLDGNVTGFRTGTTLTFRLDDPSNGTILASSTTPTTIPTSGAASFSVTIPKGTSSGSHTIYATDGSGESAGAPINVDIAAPTPTAFSTTNAGGNSGLGRIAQGDSFQAVFSQELDVGSLCSTWSGDTTNQAINTDNAITIRVNNNASLLGNDTITVTAAPGTCGGTFNFGSVDLGATGFVTADATFGGAGAQRSSLTWTPSTRTLAVTFGALSSGTAPSKLNTTLTATYTPHGSIRNSSWIPITGTVSLTGVLF